MIPQMTRKYLIPLIFLATLLCAAPARAQKVLGAMSVGVNLTQVDGDEFFGFRKFGLNVGPQVIIPFGKKSNWSVTMELLYTQKGSYHRGEYDSTTYKLKQDYAEIPVLIHFTDKKIISGGLGFSYGQLINYKETSNSVFDSLYKYQTGLSNNDICVIADLRIRLWSKLWANLRYQYSMKSNRTVLITDPNDPKNPYLRDQYNNMISIRLTWIFNQEKIMKTKKQDND